MDGSPLSPCISVCKMDNQLGDEPGGLCVGCLRSIDEIIAWGISNDDEKRTILKRVEDRRVTLGRKR